jgi:hypothetical protein
LACYDQVVKSYPGDGEAWFRRGVVCVQLQRWPDAFASLEQPQQLGHASAGPLLQYWRGKMRGQSVQTQKNK